MLTLSSGKLTTLINQGRTAGKLYLGRRGTDDLFLEPTHVGNVVVLGKNGAGKSQSLVSFAFINSQIFKGSHFYFLEAKKEPLYQVFSALAANRQPYTTRADFQERISHLYRELEQRRQLFRGHALTTFEQTATLATPPPRIFVLVDEYRYFLGDVDLHNPDITHGLLVHRFLELLTHGPAHGISFVLANQALLPTDFPEEARSALKTWFIHELNLAYKNQGGFFGILPHENQNLSPGAFRIRSGLNIKEKTADTFEFPYFEVKRAA